jgi:hypothetical protein
MQLRTESTFISFLLKGRIYIGDLWQIVGALIMEAQNEELLRRRGGMTAETALMEEKLDRCQLEVSLYSQAIHCIESQLNGNIGKVIWSVVPVTSTHASKTSPVTALQKKCETLLMGQLESAPEEPPFGAKPKVNVSRHHVWLLSLRLYLRSPLAPHLPCWAHG